MALEDRIGSTVETALAELSTRLEKDVRAIAAQLISVAQEEQDAACAAARRSALEDARADTVRQVADAELRVRASIDEAIADARDDERTKTAMEVRRLVEAEAAHALSAATAAADARLEQALADAKVAASAALAQKVKEARAREREGELASLTRVLESVRGLDGATSLSEVLDALGLAAAREASRAAVLVFRNERLLGWKLSGFGPLDTQPKAIDLGLTDSGVIGLAVGTARPMTTRDGSSAESPAFAHLPVDRMGFAVPVIVGGRVVAVVYADSGAAGKEHAVPSAWPESIEVLARHAARCLEALSSQKATSPARLAVTTGAKPASASSGETKTSAAPSVRAKADAPPGMNA